jgi:sugar phosphate isomerase/epimerase
MTRQFGQPSRRDFVKLVGAGALGLGAVRTGSASLNAAESAVSGSGRQRPLELALASYTTRQFDLDQTLEMTRRVGLPAICLKSMHLPLDATAEVIAAAAEKVKQAGVKLYGCGVVTMKTEKDVQQALEYAKMAGMSRIMAAPTIEILPVLNERLKQYDVQICIHNHGPGDKTFPTPDVAYEAIKNLDRKIGLCHDVGHTTRYGADPIAMTEKCADRIYDVHIKDVSGTTQAGDTVVCGRGVIDLPKLLRILVKSGYQGYLAFEYEAEAKDPLPGLAESVGYIRGVLDAL